MHNLGKFFMKQKAIFPQPIRQLYTQKIQSIDTVQKYFLLIDETMHFSMTCFNKCYLSTLFKKKKEASCCHNRNIKSALLVCFNQPTNPYSVQYVQVTMEDKRCNHNLYLQGGRREESHSNFTFPIIGCTCKMSDRHSLLQFKYVMSFSPRPPPF